MRKSLRKSGKSRKGGIRKVTVPSLSGLSRSQAKTLLESVGLSWYETSSNVENVNLDQSIVSQETSSGTTVNIGQSISFSYYVYVAPPPPPPPPPPPSGPPSTPPSSPPADPPSGPPSGPTNDCTDDDAGFCNNIDAQGYGDGYNYQYSPSGLFTCPPRFYGRTFCGVPTPPTAPPSTPPADPPATPPADPPAGPPADPPATPPADPPIFDGNWYGKSVNVSTLVRTPSGLVRADNLNVGDVLLSADLDGFPYNPGEGVTEEALAWTSENPNINLVNTTIVGIRRRVGDKAIIINGDIFSQYHWILVKRDNVVKFVLSENIVENSDYIFDADTNTWEIVDLFETIEVNHETISIDCEPYDMFFTEKMLTHDSFSI